MFTSLQDDTKQLSADSLKEAPKEDGGGGDRTEVKKGCPERKCQGARMQRDGLIPKRLLGCCLVPPE